MEVLYGGSKVEIGRLERWVRERFEVYRRRKEKTGLSWKRAKTVASKRAWSQELADCSVCERRKERIISRDKVHSGSCGFDGDVLLVLLFEVIKIKWTNVNKWRKIDSIIIANAFTVSGRLRNRIFELNNNKNEFIESYNICSITYNKIINGKKSIWN